MRRFLICAALLGGFTSSVPAADADFEFECNDAPQGCAALQRDFERVVEDLAAALNYKALGPAEASGITGIGVAAIGSYTEVENKQAWRNLTGTEVDAIGMAGGVVRKGLPFNIDLGAFYAGVPGASAGLLGAEVRYAILPGGVAAPALAVRGTYTVTTGVDDFDYAAWSADVSVSKGFALMTPYIGAGYVSATADPKGNGGLQKHTTENEKIFAGLRLGLGLLDITPEYERVGERNVYSLLVGLSF